MIQTPPTPPTLASAGALVGTVLTEAQSMAADAMTRGLGAIQALGNATVEIPEIVLPDFQVPAIVLPPEAAAPTPDGLDAVFAPVPPAPTRTDIGDLDLGSEPLYTLSPPMLLDIPLPDPLDAVVPTRPELRDVATPVEPDYALPAPPTFAALNIPGTPAFDVPLFEDEEPAAPLPISAEFSWAETPYESDLLDVLNEQLLDLVNGEETALSAAVEEAEWQRKCDASALAAGAVIAEALDQSAARGFSTPGGALVRAVQQAVVDAVAKDQEASRAIMIEQVRLQQQNFIFAFKNALTLETRLIELFNQVQDRALDAAKFRVSALVDLFDARVRLYQAEVTAFGAKAEVFKVRMQAALVQLEVYKAELEAVKMRGELQMQEVQLYAAQIDAVKALAEVFRARVDAVALAVQTNKARTELYRSDIQAYAALAKAGAGQVQGYLAQLDGQRSKAQIFSHQVGAYSSRVDAYRILAEAKVSEATLQFRQLQEFPVQLYRAKIDGFTAQIGGEAARLSSTASLFRARVDGYAAQERVKAKSGAASAEIATTTTRLYAAEAQVSLQAGVTNLKQSQLNEEIVQAALRAVGTLSSQLGSAAMSARNVSASLSGTTSNSAGVSASNSQSVSNSVGVSSSSSTNTNFSSTTGTSNSATAVTTNAQSHSDNQTLSETIDQSVSNSNVTQATNETQYSRRNIASDSLSSRNVATRRDVYRHRE